MDELKTRIKEYALIISPTITEGEYLDFIAEDVVDRVLAYTNRNQLIRDYEEDVEDYPITDKTDDTETYYTFWKYYTAYPIPPELERTIARILVQTHQTVSDIEDKEREVTSMKDQDQSVTFADRMKSYLATQEDSDIFSGATKILNKFRIPTIVDNT
jgi:hypothetical protein